MITWTEEELNAIYKSEEFIQNYHQSILNFYEGNSTFLFAS